VVLRLEVVERLNRQRIDLDFEKLKKRKEECGEKKKEM